MKTQRMDQLIGAHPFFEHLSQAVSEIVSGCGENQVFEPGEYLAREGQAADHFFLLRSGRVSLEVSVPGKGALIVETIETGDVLGWSWLVERYRWVFDARAVEPVRAIALDGRCLREKLGHNPALANELYSRFVRVLADRLTGARMRLMDMYSAPDDTSSDVP